MILTDEQLAALPCSDPVEHYKGKHVRQLCTDLGIEPSIDTEMTIVSKSSTLTMRWRGNVLDGGMKPVKISEEQVAARADICKACTHYRPITDRCGMCGCGAVISQRARSFHGSCPDGKW